MERGIFRGLLDDEQCLIFRHILDGRKTSQIALACELSPTQIERVIRKTCRQLQATGRQDAARIIATHYGWGLPLRASEFDIKTNAKVHIGSNRHKFQFKMNQSGRDLQIKKSHTPYIEDKWRNAVTMFDKKSVISEPIIRGKNLESYLLIRVLLLIIIITVGSALAVSALVSAMQGFDTLIGS